MAYRPCLQPGCPNLVRNGSRCPEHSGPASRGYGWTDGHRQRRLDLVAQLERDGYLVCWRCGGTITTATDMHLGHDDQDHSVTRGPEHRLCNLRASADKTNGRS